MAAPFVPDDLLSEVAYVTAANQPELIVTASSDGIVLEGKFVVSGPKGPFDAYDVRVDIHSQFPWVEPIVRETSGRIPHHPDYHVNHDGSCCVTVWEHWLASVKDHSFTSFMNGPLHQFFLGQVHFEKTGKWPFGEYAHGEEGLREAYAEVLGTPNKKKDILYHLRLLSQDWPKGHWLCPCGSGQPLRYCHQVDLMFLHEKLSPQLARRMIRRLEDSAKKK